MQASILSVFEACAAATGRAFRRPQRGSVTKCPFHDDRQASFSISEPKGAYRCFAGSCAQQGGVLDAPIAFGITKTRSESSKWLAERRLIPPPTGGAFRTITAPNRVYTNAKALPVDMRVWRYFALEDLRAFIGDMRLRSVRDSIAELRYERDKRDGDGLALLRCMAVYEASQIVSHPAAIVRLARDTFPQFFVDDPLGAA